MADLFARAVVLFGGMGVLLLILLSGRSEVISQEAQTVPIAYAMVENPETVNCLEGPCRTGIALIDPLTGEIETFRVGAVYPEGLTYSPDYSMMSYHIGTRLYVLDLETHRTRLVTHQYYNYRYGNIAAYNAWSPDSTQIAYTTYSTIDVLNLATNERHSVSNLIPKNKFHWSPDGTSLLLMADPAGRWRENYLYRIDLATGEHINLTPHFSDSFGGIWSSDSMQIAFVRLMRGTVRLYTVNADGSNLQRIDNRLPGMVFPRQWILGDRYIRLWYGEFYTFQVDTGDYIRVTKIGEQLPESETLGIDISPNGEEFVILRRDQTGRRDEWLSIYDFETLERRDFMIKTASFAYPEWGSD
ncbi:MAG: hypothetical protein RLP44_28150 [Aggregatilineales bacterium]